MEPATDSAATNNVAATMELRGAKSPKLAKITASQSTKIAINGYWIELPIS